MTVVARRLPADLAGRFAVGTPAEVAAIVARVRESGRLVSITLPRLDARGRTFVYVTFRTLPDRRQARRRRLLIAAAVLAAVLLPLAAVWMLLKALAAVFPYAVGALLIVGLALWLPGHSGACTGLHCKGCRG